MPTHATFISHKIGGLSHSRKSKEIKSIQTGREEVKLPLFVDKIFYIEKPKVSTPKLLELINELSKVARYEINI